MNLQENKDNILISDDGYVYVGVPYDKKITNYDFSYAYIIDDMFYPYRGEYNEKKSVLPGIYSSGSKSIIIKPDDKDIDAYKTETHRAKIDSEEIYKGIVAKEDEFQIYSDGKSAYIPDITVNDDPFKRALKEAIIAKGIDIDSIKDRFSDSCKRYIF